MPLNTASDVISIRPRGKSSTAMSISLYLLTQFSLLGTMRMTNLSDLCPESQICRCTPNVQMVDINCFGVSDLSQVQLLLQEHFTNTTINKLFLQRSSVTAIPSLAFGNLSIRTIFFDCPLNEMEEDAFGGLKGMIHLKIVSSKFVTIPSAVGRATGLMGLVMENGGLESLGSELVDQRELLFLSLKNNSLMTLSSNSLSNLVKIQRLDLSQNNLTFIDSKALDSLTSLQWLFLGYNNLRKVDGILKNLNPTVIDLQSNNLTSVDILFPLGMWNVNQVFLARNPLRNISPDAFAGRIPNVNFLDLEATNLTNLDPKLFQSLPRLVTLDLDNNRMQYISSDLFQHLLSLETLKLSKNNIVSIKGLFQSVPHMLYLSLANNMIEVLGDELQKMPKLQVLYLFHNHISYISRDNFLLLNKLEQLDLSFNFIYCIEEGSFSSLSSLERLILTSNDITTLNHSVHSLPSLSVISLSKNKIRIIDDSELIGLPSLESFYVFNNGVESLDGAFGRLPVLANLELSSNQLSSLSRDSFSDLIHLKTLIFNRGNNWACDCRILWLLDWLSATNFTALKDKPVCRTPKRLHKVPFQRLIRRDLTNWPEDCPDSCTCSCEPQDRDFYISANCSGKNFSSMPDTFPPHLGKLDMSNNFLNALTNFTIWATDYFWYLNVEDNWLTSLNTKFSSGLNTLLLSRNNLTRFDPTSLSNKTMSNISLSGNPWTCDCETVSFRRWLLSQSKVVYDVNDTRCGPSQENQALSNKVIVFLTDTDLCPPKLALYISISVGVLVTLLVVVSLMLTYSRNQLSIKVWMYAHGITWVKEEDLDVDKMFDVFISYSSYDEEFVVLQFISGMKEKLPEISICTQDLFPPGEYIQTNIFNAVQASKRTLLVLSENFLRSSWCMMEFRAAYTQALEDKIHRLLIVRYGDISPSSEIDPTLQTYLDSTTYLKWGEKYFWEKLLYSLPKKKAKKTNKKHSSVTSNCDTTSLLSP